jgi:hypothetical protein
MEMLIFTKRHAFFNKNINKKIEEHARNFIKIPETLVKSAHTRIEQEK